LSHQNDIDSLQLNLHALLMLSTGTNN